MNRRQKIIVSITGIFIVLLALVGLTYAYFLTRITGNENGKSISVTTANLELLYSDGNGMLSATNIEPGDYITFTGKTSEGVEFETEEKTFSVENKGNVAISYGIYLEEIINEFKRYDDVVLTITCTSTKNGNTCEGFSGTFPRIDALVTTNKVEVGEKHNYTLKVQYKEMNVDQSIDMNKRLSAKVQLYGLNNTLDNESSLAYKIIDNAKKGVGSTTYRSVPLSLPARETTNKQIRTESETSSTIALVDTSYYTYAKEVEFNELAGYSLVNPQVDTWANIKSNPSKLANFKYLRRENGLPSAPIDENGNPTERTQNLRDIVAVTNATEDLISYKMLELKETNESKEHTLSATLDDYGISYYFRGNVENNYAEFNNMCWQIVRIEGDGSIKMMLASENGCNEVTDGSRFIESKTRYGRKHDTTLNIYTADYIGDDQYYLSTNTILNKWYTDNNFDSSKLKKGDWCINNLSDAYATSTPYNKLTESASSLISNKISFTYESYNRLYRAYPERTTLKCDNGTKFSSYIALINVDEASMAGLKIGYNSPTNFLASDGAYLTLSVASFSGTQDNLLYIGDSIFYASGLGLDLTSPMIILNNNVIYNSGNGTLESPYKIVEN